MTTKDDILNNLELEVEVTDERYGMAGWVTLKLLYDREVVTSCDIDGSDIERIVLDRDYQ